MATKTHERNGFVYQCERFFVSGRWATIWHFRPVAEEHWVHYSSPSAKTDKSTLEAFLSETDQALRYYREDIARRSNVEAAEAALEFARSRFERLNHPDYDPGGSTNNPGKVAREIREIADSEVVVKRAQDALEQAKALRAALAL